MWKVRWRPVTVDRTCAHQPAIAASGAAHLHAIICKGAVTMTTDILWFSELGLKDLDRVGGLDTDDVTALAAAGQEIRALMRETPFLPDFEAQIRNSYQQLVDKHGGSEDLSWAVRSSATAEDLPDASFAGQQETFLNVRGIENILAAIKDVFASLYNDRAIAYRVHHKFEHADVALSAGIQRMVRSDVGASGVMFTMDTESGFKDAVFVTSSYGLGEAVVQGAVNPDEFYVYKPALEAGRPAILKRGLGEKALQMTYTSNREIGHTIDFVPVEASLRNRFSLTDDDVEQLARHAVAIEKHYGRPMDIEWGKDGIDGGLYILQARPETVQSRRAPGSMSRFRLNESGPVLVEGRAIGQRIGAGKVRILTSIDQMAAFKTGDVLVADMTDPDWEPIMKRASAIVTNRGGRTCHAAIIARELGVPAVVGCGDATSRITDGDQVTVSCAEGDTGFIYGGKLPYERVVTDLSHMPPAPLKIMMNVGNPERAFDFAQLPNQGIGLARLEFIIARQIGVHPKALLEYDRLNAETKRQIEPLMAGYASPVDFYVDRLAEGMATLTAAFAPYPVIVRLSDFKSNEYANLIGGSQYEPHEENPMIGFRGASRYVDPSFADCFALECRAVKKVRNEMGLTNCWIMIPFVRTVDEGRQVIEV